MTSSLFVSACLLLQRRTAQKLLNCVRASRRCRDEWPGNKFPCPSGLPRHDEAKINTCTKHRPSGQVALRTFTFITVRHAFTCTVPYTCTRMKAYTPNLKSFVQLGLFARHFDVLLWHLLTWVHPALCTSTAHVPTHTKPQQSRR